MACLKVPRRNGNLLVPVCVDVLEPVRLRTKATHYDDFRYAWQISNYLQYRLSTQSVTAPCVTEKEKAMTKEPAKVPAVKMKRSSKNEPQYAFLQMMPIQFRCLSWPVGINQNQRLARSGVCGL